MTATLTEYLGSRGSRIRSHAWQKWDWITGAACVDGQLCGFTPGLPRRMSRCWIQGSSLLPRSISGCRTPPDIRYGPCSTGSFFSFPLATRPGRSQSSAVCALPRPSVFAPHCSLTSSDGVTVSGLPEGRDSCRRLVAFAFSLMLAFSQSMWSQAVIAEVYALHALLIAVFLTLCYSWVLRPDE